MIKLKVLIHRWSEDERVQAAYQKGCRCQADADAEEIKRWLVEAGQIEGWLAPEIEIVEEQKEDEVDSQEKD